MSKQPQEVPDGPEPVFADGIPYQQHHFEDGLQVTGGINSSSERGTSQVAYGKEWKQSLPDRSLPEVREEPSRSGLSRSRRKFWIWLISFPAIVIVVVAASVTTVLLIHKNQAQSNSSAR